MVMVSLTLSNTCHPGLKGRSHNFTLKIQNQGPGTAHHLTEFSKEHSTAKNVRILSLILGTTKVALT